LKHGMPFIISSQRPNRSEANDGQRPLLRDAALQYVAARHAPVQPKLARARENLVVASLHYMQWLAGGVHAVLHARHRSIIERGRC
jgi:NADPH-dependent ferric siderophore reductase